MRKFLLFVLLIPIVEIAFVLLSGKLIGALWTIVLIIFTGALGFYLLKVQGSKAKKELERSVKQGNPPGPALVEGVLLLLAGVLLLLPGFLSDILGVLLLIKPVRKLGKPLIFRWLKRKYSQGNVVVYRN
ncbi:MAG: FxsA family protein [Kurthia sp.]|nr:FxsA family protein [Candidatus Kurthia equi]